MSAEPAVKLHSPDLTDPAPEAPALDETPARKRLIRLADLFTMLDVGRATGHRLIAAGRIGPMAIRLTPGCVRFCPDEVDAWLSTRRPDGGLHDAKSWPAVWAMIQKRNRT